MEKELLEAFLRYEETKSYIEKLNEIRERGEIDVPQYNASMKGYDRQLGEARSALAEIRLQIRDAAESKRTEFDIYQQELKDLQARLSAGALTAKQYLKEKDRPGQIVAHAQSDFGLMKALLEARSSDQVRDISVSAGQRGGAKHRIPIGQRQRFFTVGPIIALVASILVMVSPFLPLVNIPDVGGISLLDISSEVGHPIWAYPLVYGLFALAFIFPPPRTLRGAVHFLMVALVVLVIVIAVQAGRAEAEAQFADVSSAEMNFESSESLLPIIATMTLSIMGVGAIAFLLGLLGILAAGVIELCRGAAGITTVIVISCLMTLGSVGHLTFWFDMLKPRPAVNVKISDLKNRDGAINARRATITIRNTGSRALRLWNSLSKCEKAAIDYALSFQRFNKEDGKWEDQSPAQNIDIAFDPGMRNTFVLPTAVKPGEQRNLTMTFSPVWDPQGRDGRGSRAGKYRICLAGKRRQLPPKEFNIKSVPGPNDVAKKELAKARAVLKQEDLVGGMLVLKRIPRGSLLQREISDELEAAEGLSNLKQDKERPQTEDELKELQTKIERLVARHRGAVTTPQAERLLGDVKSEIKDMREDKAKKLLAEAKRLYDGAEQSHGRSDHEDAIRAYQNTIEKCNRISVGFGDTSSTSEARRLKGECDQKILEVKAERTLNEAKRLIDQRSYISAGTLLCQEYHRGAKRREFQEQIDHINKWAEDLNYEQLTSEYRRFGDTRKSEEYKKLSETAQTDFNLKIVNMFSSARKGRLRKEEALKIFGKFLEEYPQSKRADEVKQYINELGGEVPLIINKPLFTLP